MWLEVLSLLFLTKRDACSLFSKTGMFEGEQPALEAREEA
jgi:hypothetical protein